MSTALTPAPAPAPAAGPPAAGRAGRRADLARLGFYLPATLYLLVFFGYPIVTSVVMSFQDYTVNSFYTGDAPWNGLANYAEVFRDELFGATLWHTAVFTAASLAFQFAIGLALAVFFRRHFPLGGVLRALLLLPWLLPLIVSGTVFRWLLDQDYGVVNNVLTGLNLISEPVPWLVSTDTALIAVIITNIWIGIPFNMVILYGGLQSIPDTLYEAAALDGAGPWQRFRHITWPLLRPVTAVVLMLGLIYTVKAFDVVIVLTQGGPADSTQLLSTWSYELSFTDLHFGQGAAVGNVLIAIAMLFAVVYLRSTRRAEAEQDAR
ncbi:carbohydrate ABC transporter permease [Allostreptomyces psammosilenae]|uniref:Multiple sugar transport system permease protein n=1 Tax=Allostreptomyces psammosilenae TaxID=1892865 RepID=A0A853AAZ6_9ACTN|nr:sugar ABC transporter permease [Allostreptomyces psammosilenae]NYI07678.1 multiple sugar transport system permease protein [Allostreptomyces psammosilenae]